MLSKFFRNKKKEEKPIDVTEICRDTYDTPTREEMTLGGKGASSGAAKDWRSSLNDWKRAVSPGNGGQEVFFFSDEAKSGQVTLNQILKEIYQKETDEEKERDIVYDGKHYTFKNVESLKKFFKEYLFSKVKDEKEKDLLADDALLHLHQGGLPNTLNTLIFESFSQTLNTKTVHKPTSWKDTYTPLDNGVVITVEHDYSGLIVNSWLKSKLKETPDEDRVLMSLRCDSTMYVDKDESGNLLVKHEILQASYTIKDESIKDFIFGLGFVVDYPDKKEMFETLFNEINKLSEDKDNNLRNELGDIVENFRFVDLHNDEDLRYFQNMLGTKIYEFVAKINDINSKKLTGTRREEVNIDKINQAYNISMNLDQFISDKIDKIKPKEGMGHRK